MSDNNNPNYRWPGEDGKPKTKKSFCSGCEDNFYNGNNTYGVKECWRFKSAKVKLRKRVHINHVPPWTQKPTRMLSCYHEKQYVFVDGDRQY